MANDAEPDQTSALSLMSEENLALRIQHEMEKRGWSQERMAKEMTDAGYPLHQSAVSKIVKPKGGKRRSISVEDAIGFATVFGVTLDNLLIPLEAVLDEEMRKLITRLAEIHVEQTRLADEASATVARISKISAEDAEKFGDLSAFVDKEILGPSLEQMRTVAIRWFNQMHARGELPEGIDPINPEVEPHSCDCGSDGREP